MNVLTVTELKLIAEDLHNLICLSNCYLIDYKTGQLTLQLARDSLNVLKQEINLVEGNTPK